MQARKKANTISFAQAGLSWINRKAYRFGGALF